MATEASLPEQRTDEVKGSTVIDNVKIIEEDSVSQPKQAEGSETGKDKVEEPVSSETSLPDPKEMIEIKDEASATKEVKKEGEDDTPSASGGLEDKKDAAPAVDEAKNETVSQVSSSEVLVDNKEASATEEVKKDVEDSMASVSGVLEDKKEDLRVVNEVKKETDSQVSGSEVLVDKKEASATEEVKKEDEDDMPSALEVLKDKKEDAAAVEEIKKETDSQASGSEVLVVTKEASATGEVKKEDEDNTASASGVSEDNKEDAPAVDEVKKETGSQDSVSEVLWDNKDGASVVEDVKKEAEAVKTSGISDAEVEASIGSPEEKSISTTKSSSGVADKALLDSSSSSVQESEYVGHEPEVLKPLVERAKGIEEPLDISTNADLPSEAVAKSEEQSVALTVMEPAPDAIEELEKKKESSEADEITEAAKDENISTVVENSATVEDKSVSEPLKEKPVVEVENSASQALDTVPGDSAEVEARDIVGKDSVSENTEKARDDTNSGGCQEEAKIEESEHNTTESFGREATVDTSLPNPPVAAGESGAVDATSATDAAEIVVNTESKIEEQNGEKIMEVELVKEQKEEKPVEEEGVKEQDQEEAVKMASILTAAEEFEAPSEQEKPSKDADKASEVAEEFPEEPKHELVNIEDNVTSAQTSRDTDLSGPATQVTESVPEEEKPPEGADKVVVQRDSGVSDSATKSTEGLEKEKVSEVAEQSVEELKRDNENIKDNMTLAQASRDTDLGEQTKDTDTCSGEQVVKLNTEKSSTNTAGKDETEKNDEAEKSNAQDLVEASKDGIDSKTNTEIQKAEASGKTSKTLMSKVKHSIVKVKKAIIGKSPSSKTISAESKAELKVK